MEGRCGFNCRPGFLLRDAAAHNKFKTSIARLLDFCSYMRCGVYNCCENVHYGLLDFGSEEEDDKVLRNVGNFLHGHITTQSKNNNSKTCLSVFILLYVQAVFGKVAPTTSQTKKITAPK